MTEDRIVIRDLLVRGVIGINDWERQVRQDILVNLTVYADLTRAGETDLIDDTVDYKRLTKAVIAHVEASKRQTVEALAADVAAICLDQPGVVRARVRIEKPGALRFATSVGVEIERSRGELPPRD